MEWLQNIDTTQIEAIIVALMTALAGTGTIALIAKVALNGLVKALQTKITVAEQQNKISSDISSTAMKGVELFQIEANKKIDELHTIIVMMKETYEVQNAKVQALIDTIEQRDEQIATLIEQQLGDGVE